MKCLTIIISSSDYILSFLSIKSNLIIRSCSNRPFETLRPKSRLSADQFGLQFEAILSSEASCHCDVENILIARKREREREHRTVSSFRRDARRIALSSRLFSYNPGQPPVYESTIHPSRGCISPAYIRYNRGVTLIALWFIAFESLRLSSSAPCGATSPKATMRYAYASLLRSCNFIFRFRYVGGAGRRFIHVTPFDHETLPLALAPRLLARICVACSS